MLLTILERLILLDILPKKGDFTTLKIVRKLREDLSFSEEEHAVLHFKQLDANQIQWDVEAAKDLDTEITIGEKAADIIVEALKKLDEDKILQDNHYTLYEKFVEA